jgi:hypothetical protein
MLRIPHCIDNRLTDVGKVVSLTHQPTLIPRNIIFLTFLLLIFVRGSVNVRAYRRIQLLSQTVHICHVSFAMRMAEAVCYKPQGPWVRVPMSRLNSLNLPNPSSGTQPLTEMSIRSFAGRHVKQLNRHL